jgi:type II secretory pathway component GspD/PulD (secretin)
VVVAVAAEAAAMNLSPIHSNTMLYNVMSKFLAGLSLIAFGAIAYPQQQPPPGPASAQSPQQLSRTSVGRPASVQPPTQVQIDTYVVEINSDVSLFGALHWGNTLKHNSATFALNGSVGAPSDAIFPNRAFFDKGFVLAEPAAQVTIPALIQLGNLKATDPPNAYIENGQRVLIRSLQQRQTIFLETVAAAPYTFNTGLTLDEVPRVLQGGIIDLTIKPTFSAQIGSQGDADVPIISAGSATAEVKLRSGEAAVIGGLTRVAHNYSKNNVPGLQNIPLVEYLLASRASKRTNLVIIVWPRIVGGSG